MNSKFNYSNLNLYNYNFDESLIAQSVLPQRSASRLMQVNKADGQINHRTFKDFINLIPADALLVFNHTGVRKCRLFAKLLRTNKTLEIFFLEKTQNQWKCLCKPGKKLKLGDWVQFLNHQNQPLPFYAMYHKKEEEIFFFEFSHQLNKIKKWTTSAEEDFFKLHGNMPLPPYIKNKLENENRYQTIYCNKHVSSAAPTAGLHFDREIIEKLKAKKIAQTSIHLQIGLATFKNVQTENIKKHKMHRESYQITSKTAEQLNQAKKRKNPIIAIGTTSLRCLEANYHKYGLFVPEKSGTELFIYPPEEIQSIDGLLTNFHLPKSTLLMLVSAFLGYEKTMEAYKQAVKKRYRFFSLGDSMLIL